MDRGHREQAEMSVELLPKKLKPRSTQLIKPERRKKGRRKHKNKTEQ